MVWRKDAVAIGVDFDAGAPWLVQDAAGRTTAALLVIEQQHAERAALELLPHIGQTIVVGVGLGADQRLAAIALASIHDAVAARRPLDQRFVTNRRHPRVLMAVTLARVANLAQLPTRLVVLPAIDAPIAIAVGLDAHGAPVVHI